MAVKIIEGETNHYLKGQYKVYCAICSFAYYRKNTRWDRRHRFLVCKECYEPDILEDHQIIEKQPGPVPHPIQPDSDYDYTDVVEPGIT